MKRFLSMSVTKLMIALTASGFFVALSFATPTILGLLDEKYKYRNDAELAHLTFAVGELVHELQKERGKTAGFLASNGRDFGDTLLAQRDVVDEAITGFLSAMDKAETILSSRTSTVEKLNNIRTDIIDILELRHAVDAQQIESLSALTEFTKITNDAIALLPEIGRDFSDARAATAVQSHFALMTAKDTVGLQRALGAIGFNQAIASNGVFPEDTLRWLNGLIQKQDALIEIYLQTASDDQIEALDQLDNSPAALTVKKLREAANSGDAAAILAIKPESWFEGMTKKIDLLRHIEDQGAAELANEADDAWARAKLILIEAIALLGSLLLVIGVGAVFLARRVANAIALTSGRVTALAEGDLDSEIPEVAPTDLKRITDALAVFRAQELESRRKDQERIELENDSAAGIARVTREVSAGDFSSRIRLRNLRGASKLLGEGINQIMTVVQEVAERQSARDQKALEDQKAIAEAGEQVVQELNEVVSACIRGDFSQRLATDGKDGVLAELCDGVNKIGEVTYNGLSGLMHVLEAIEKGDLSQRMSEDYEGIFLEISRKLNSTTTELSEVVGQIAEGAQTLEMSSIELSDTADDLARRTEKTAAALEETSASVAKLTSSVNSTAQGAKDVGNRAETTQKETEDTVVVATDMVAAMEGIAASSEEISVITGMIDDIAFQTNLLALNAGVEAARAGEQGKGFAVVATEVRVLAQRAAEAASRISRLISQSKSEVSAGVELVDRSRSSLDAIEASISSMTREVVQMVETSAEQSADITEIDVVVKQMDQTTQRNAAICEETNAVAQTLKYEASRLTNAISHFTISDGGDELPSRHTSEENCQESPAGNELANTGIETMASTG